MNERLTWLIRRYPGHEWRAQAYVEGVYSRLLRDEVSRQIALLERRIRERAYAPNASSVPALRLSERQPVSQEEADIREKRAMSVYEAMRHGAKHDQSYAKRYEAEQRLKKQLELMDKLQRETRPYVEKRSTKDGPSNGDPEDRHEGSIS